MKIKFLFILILLLIPAITVFAEEKKTGFLEIYDQEIQHVIPSAYLIKWKTNIPVSSNVVYDLSSKPASEASFTGYGLKEATTTHTIAVWGLAPSREYYIRPFSGDGEIGVYGDEMISVYESPVPGFISGQCNYLSEYLKFGQANRFVEVMKLQMFLKEREGFNDIIVGGYFDEITLKAVKSFQEKYKEDILEPWGVDTPTGYVYITTTKKINELYCQREFELTSEHKEQIESFREMTQAVQKQGGLTSEDFEKMPEFLEEVGFNEGKVLKYSDLKSVDEGSICSSDSEEGDCEEVEQEKEEKDKKGFVSRILSAIAVAISKLFNKF